MKPTRTAATRLAPIRSPRIGPAMSATISGEAKVIEVICVSGR
jgi:hypothetical protein